MKTFKKYLIVSVEFLLLVILTLIISHFNLDIKVQHYFYQPDSSSGWYLKNHPFWQFGYHYGTLPAILLTFAALIGLILSWVKPKIKNYRRYFLLIILTLVIGPGLFVNAIFKDHWGRPRPRQVQEFGGKLDFREVWEPGTPGKGKSFPCGHCSMGFFFITLYYCFKRKHKVLAYSAIVFSIALGMFIGFARITQGGHFLSDVLWAWGLTYLTAIGLYYFILKIPEHEQKFERQTVTAPIPLSQSKRILIWVAIILSIGIMLFTFLFSKPFYQESSHELQSDDLFKSIRLQFDMDRGDIFIHCGRYQNPIAIKNTIQGFGFPEYRYESHLTKQSAGDTLQAIYALHIQGLFNEIDIATSVYLDSSRTIYLTGRTKKGSIVFDNQISKNIIFAPEMSALLKDSQGLIK
jgi:membrane-associated PAP2 superfamily phosphatase